MVKMESNCIGCDWPGGCGGCVYRGKSPHVYCDDCGIELDDAIGFRLIDGYECLCDKCAAKNGAFDENGDLYEEEWESFNAIEDAEDRAEAAYEAQKESYNEG